MRESIARSALKIRLPNRDTLNYTINHRLEAGELRKVALSGAIRLVMCSFTWK
jgi:hypothetical protein